MQKMHELPHLGERHPVDSFEEGLTVSEPQAADLIKSVKAYVQMPLLYNHWYIAGTVDEFGRDPVSRTLLDHSIVFYRTQAGQLSVLQNRCLHRSYPLSEGRLEGDNLVCRYHGARYSPDGNLLRVPCQEAAPRRALRKYPVKEIGPFVMIWMGDCEADLSKLPDLSHLASPSYRTLHGVFEVKGSYLLMHENLNDFTHFPYLHHDSFGVDDSFLELPAETKKSGKRVSVRRVETHQEGIRASMIPPGVLKSLAGVTLSRYDEGASLSPGVFVSDVWMTRGDEGKVNSETMRFFICHYVTPITKTTCRYWWSVSFNYGLDESDFFEQIPVFLSKGWGEDVIACASMQVLLDEDKTDFKEMNVAGDQAGLLFRQVMLEWAKEEYGSALTSA
jgi:vanillate O-demethylase monooxygenase subunit